MHLRLIKGLSYDGVVRASAAHPDVFVDDPEKYTALLESGYFEALPDAHTVTGHLDADFLGEMDEEQLNKLADDMGVDTTGKDKAAVVAALTKAGFKLEAESNLYKHPDDPRTAIVFDPAIRGKTDQFTLRFRKPR